MKKRMLSLMLCLTVVMSYMIPTVKADQFYDVGYEHWAYDYITEMVQRGVLSGYGDGTFRPDRDVTRAEFATIMTSAAGLNVTSPDYSSFDDVDIYDWYCPYIEAAKYYLSGYETYYGYYYMPDDLALREDIAVAMVKLKGYDTSVYNLSNLQAMFSDWQSISTDAQKYVAIAVERGLISGYEDHTFRGQDSITRAEAATLLWKAYQYGNDNKNFSGETPTVTAAPTDAPEKTPETAGTPKPTSTPNPDRLPYKIDSLCSASVKDTYLMATQDNNDNLYYYDSGDNAVYKINMDTGKKSQILDVSSLTYEVYKDEEQEVTETVTKKVPRTVIEEVPVDNDESTGSETGDDTDETNEEENSYNEDSEGEETAPTPAPSPKTKQVEKTVYDEVTEEVTSIKTVSVLQGHYKDYEVGQLYYNTGNNKLLLVGTFANYKSEKSHNDKTGGKAVIYEIKGNEAKVHSETEIETEREYYNTIRGIQGNMDNGNVLIYYRHFGDFSYNYYAYLYNLPEKKEVMEFNYRYHIDTQYYSTDNGFLYSNGNKVYYCQKGRVLEYNFSNKSLKALWDDAVGESAHGLNNKTYYAWDVSNGEINKISSDGEPQKLDINTETDIEVNDFYNMPTDFKNANERMFITNDESFIFYDTAAAGGTWRKISKQ